MSYKVWIKKKDNNNIKINVNRHSQLNKNKEVKNAKISSKPVT